MTILSTLSSPPYVVPADSFATGAGDATTLQAAINAAQVQGQGGVILLSARTYRLTSTVVLPSGTRLLGSGAPATGAGTLPGVPGTIVTGAVVLFRASSSAAAPADSLAFQAITFDGGSAAGGAGASDLIELYAVADLRFERCLFQNGAGCYLSLWQAVGVQLVDCAFLGGGSTTLPAVAIQSGGTYGISQAVSLRGCAFSNYAGTALAITGAGGADFTILNCAFNSPGSGEPALVLNDAIGINLTGVSIVSAGLPGHNLQAQLSLADSTLVCGALTVQHNPGRGSAATFLLSFVALSGGAGAIDLVLFDADSDPRTAPTPAKAVAATSSVHGVDIRTYAYSSTASPAFAYAVTSLV